MTAEGRSTEAGKARSPISFSGKFERNHGDSVTGMALIVFLRGVNVGGHRTFRPSMLARELSDYDVVNVGAAGTFIVRKPGQIDKLFGVPATTRNWNTILAVLGLLKDGEKKATDSPRTT